MKKGAGRKSVEWRRRCYCYIYINEGRGRARAGRRGKTAYDIICECVIMCICDMCV